MEADFIFTVKEVFHLGTFDMLVGIGNMPVYNGVITCEDVSFEIRTPWIWGDQRQDLENLSFQLRNGRADGAIIGKTFRGKNWW